MPDLEQSLQGQDLGHLRIIAQLWGIEFNAPDTRIGLQRLVPMISDDELLHRVVAEMPLEAQQALDELLANDGRMSWSLFTRRYGALREMGAARRDRDHPYSDNQARASEALWYRGLIGRGFFDTPDGLEEFAYIPDDFLLILPQKVAKPAAPGPLGRPATRAEKSCSVLADDKILDDVCTMLAGRRTGMDLDAIQAHLISISESRYALDAQALETLLVSAGLLDQEGQIILEPVRQFLEKTREAALLELFRSWMSSQQFNELRLIPGIKIEGVWRNDPLSARQSILDFLSTIPGRLPGGGEAPVFWSLNSFVNAAREIQPDFQRPSRDYDTWYLQDVDTGEYLRGFQNWDRVDGELIRFTLCGPLHWLGLLDLGFQCEDQASMKSLPSAFRFSEMAFDLFNLKLPQGLAAETDKMQVSSDGRIFASRHLARSARYQLARFTEWIGYKRDQYEYRLSPASLDRAGKQGLTIPHLLTLLNRYTKQVPPNLVRALENWERHGEEARLERVMVLKVRTPEVLQAIRQSKASRFLGTPLGPTTVEVRAEAWKKIVQALAELGYLVDSVD